MPNHKVSVLRTVTTGLVWSTNRLLVRGKQDPKITTIQIRLASVKPLRLIHHYRTVTMGSPLGRVDPTTKLLKVMTVNSFLSVVVGY